MLLLGFTLLFILWTQNPLFAILSLIAVFINTSFILLTLNVSFLALIYLVIYVGAICSFYFCPYVLNLRSYDVRERKFKALPFVLAYICYVITYFSSLYNIIDVRSLNENIYHIIFILRETPIITNYLLNNKLLFVILTLLLFIAIISPVLLSNERVTNNRTIDAYLIFVRKQNTIILTKQHSLFGLNVVAFTEKPLMLLIYIYFFFVIYQYFMKNQKLQPEIMFTGVFVLPLNSIPALSFGVFAFFFSLYKLNFILKLKQVFHMKPSNGSWCISDSYPSFSSNVSVTTTKFKQFTLQCRTIEQSISSLNDELLNFASDINRDFFLRTLIADLHDKTYRVFSKTVRLMAEIGNTPITSDFTLEKKTALLSGLHSSLNNNANIFFSSTRKCIMESGSNHAVGFDRAAQLFMVSPENKVSNIRSILSLTNKMYLDFATNSTDSLALSLLITATEHMPF